MLPYLPDISQASCELALFMEATGVGVGPWDPIGTVQGPVNDRQETMEHHRCPPPLTPPLADVWLRSEQQQDRCPLRRVPQARPPCSRVALKRQPHPGRPRPPRRPAVAGLWHF